MSGGSSANAQSTSASVSSTTSSQSSTSGSTKPAATPKTAPPVTVSPGEQKTAHGVKVTNGNYGGDFPQYANSTGKAKIKVVDGNTEVKTENGFKGQIDDLSAGETVVVAASNNPVTVNGNGGSVVSAVARSSRSATRAARARPTSRARCRVVAA